MSKNYIPSLKTLFTDLSNITFNWLEEYGKFLREHLKVSKLGFLWDPLIQSWESMNVKSTGELSFMKMKNDAKFENELTFHLKVDILTRALENLENFHFNVLLLSKVYIVWAKKVQRSYVSWNWRGIPNVERNQLVFFKIDIRNLTNFELSTRKSQKFSL